MFYKGAFAMAESKNIFAERLEKLIKENNYTHENVASGIDVTRQAVGKWVKGDSVPDVLTAAKLAKFFKVSVDYLAGISPHRTLNKDLSAVCEYTGLSEETVKTISSYFKPRKRMASEIIKSDEFLRIIDIFLNAQSHKEFLQPSGEAIAIALMARINSIKDVPALNDIPPVFIDALSVIGSNGLEPMYKQQIFDEMTVLFEKIIESGD